MICRLSTGLSCAPVSRSCRICACVGRVQRLLGADAAGRGGDGERGLGEGPTEGGGTLRGSAEVNNIEPMFTALPATVDGGRMATVLQEVPTAEGKAWIGDGGEARCRIDRVWIWPAAEASRAAGGTPEGGMERAEEVAVRVLCSGRERGQAFDVADGGMGEAERDAGDLEPLPLAPLPLPLLEGVRLLFLGMALGEGDLPLVRLPLPFERGGLGRVAGESKEVARKVSVMCISKSSSERGMKEAMRVS